MPRNAHGIAAVLLAAGGSVRLNGNKLLLPWRGEPLIAHLARAASRAAGLLSLTVVLGHNADAVREAVAKTVPASPLPVQFMLNHTWREGMGTSLRRALEGLLAAPGAEKIGSVMVLLADQPLVSTRTLEALIQTHARAMAKNSDHPATAPAYQGRRGNPVIVSRRLFPAIATLRGDTGARHILQNLGSELLLAAVDDPGILHDVDTPEDYAALLAEDGGAPFSRGIAKTDASSAGERGTSGKPRRTARQRPTE